MRINKLFALLGAILAVGLGTPQQAHSSPDGHWASGQEFFTGVCARCHTTGVGPAILGRNLDPHFIKWVVRHGLVAMPAFPESSLDDPLLDAVAKYVAESVPEQSKP